MKKILNINKFKELPKSGKVYMWANQERYQVLKNDMKFLELDCTTCDRELFIIDVDKKEFEVSHKHSEGIII